ncbi:MAG: hypothetical protein A2201_08060 [Alicyclobacillus sp. RIFOXYA1_FULL_53_8]|nr:MAG: hypothetical protein A2201_08060 [Alicyclobacillus sp. RIFOXYA1_FULL_53_8]
MTTSPSTQWSDAQLNVNAALASLLNTLRDLGYNPNLHITYDKSEHLLLVHESILAAHQAARDAYGVYVDACERRDEAVAKIQEMPKTQLGF